MRMLSAGDIDAIRVTKRTTPPPPILRLVWKDRMPFLSIFCSSVLPTQEKRPTRACTMAILTDRLAHDTWHRRLIPGHGVFTKVMLATARTKGRTGDSCLIKDTDHTPILCPIPHSKATKKTRTLYTSGEPCDLNGEPDASGIFATICRIVA